MADYTKLYRHLDTDEEFNAMSKSAQHLYMRLLATSTLNHAGVCDWRPVRMLGKWPGATVEEIRETAEELRAERFAFADETTEEMLVRSYMRWDRAVKIPNPAVAVRRAVQSIASHSLRRVAIWELHRFHEAEPDLAGWPKLADLLSKPPINPSDDPRVNPSIYPSNNPSDNGKSNGSKSDTKKYPLHPSPITYHPSPRSPSAPTRPTPMTSLRLVVSPRRRTRTTRPTSRSSGTPSASEDPRSPPRRPTAEP